MKKIGGVYMVAKVRDYGKLAKDIKNAIGEENIISAAHCATRLRLVLKQNPSADVTAQISKMPAVIQVVEKGGQYQIVIGTHAKDVYEELTHIIKLDTSQVTKGSLLNRIIAAMSAVFAPFVYILAGAGLLQGCLIIINLFSSEFSQTGTYSVLSFISWTPFTFLPVLIAVTASKHFRCNTFIALWCCLALVNPDWGNIARQIAEGESIKFLFFNMAQTTYTSSVLPPLFLVLVLSYLERFLDRHIPDVVKALVIPFICAVIMVPTTILIIGPLSDMLANAIATGYNFLYTNLPALAAIIIGGFWQIAVIFGVHWGVTPMVMSNFANHGCDSFQAVQTCAVVAQAAACFGVFLKTRNKEMKNVSLSAGLPGILTVVNAISPDNPMSFPGLLAGCGVTIVTAILLVQIIGCDESVTTKKDNINKQKTIVSTDEITIYSPLNGNIKELKEVNDPTFANGILGQGIAIVPSEGKLYAPFDGKVNFVFDTKHAICLENAVGVEMLIHIGLETVNLNGKYFTPKVNVGDTIKKGDLLVEFDLNQIKKEYETITPVLITNADSFSIIEPIKTTGIVNVGDEILKAK